MQLSSNNREGGVAVLIVVLFTAILLAVITAITATFALGARRVGASEVAAFRAVLASESGQNAFVIRSRALAEYGGNIPSTCSGTARQRFTCGLTDWLNSETEPGQTIGGFAVGSNSTASLRVANTSIVRVVTPDGTEVDRLATVDIEARGNVASDQARVVQRYSATKKDIPFPNIPGAVTSYPSVQIQGGPSSTINGTTATESGNTGLYEDLLTVRRAGPAVAALAVGAPTQVEIDNNSLNRAGQVPVGSYIRLPLSSFGSVVSGNPMGTFKVTANTGSRLTVTPVSLPTITGGAVIKSGNIDLDYIMNAIQTINGNVLTLNNREAFVKGDTLAFQVGSTTYRATVSSVASVPGTATNNVTVTDWSPSAPSLISPSALEGTPVTKSTNAVVTAGSFTTGGQASASGSVVQGMSGQELLPSPLNDAMFVKTFQMTPTVMRSLANRVTESQFNGDVNGLMWLTSSAGDRNINLNNEKLQGTGILIIDGDLTINQSQSDACGFSGVLYVRGNVDIRGNLELCGALVVEGSILSQDGLTVTGIDTDDSDFGGNGRKVKYDPKAIFDAVNGTGAYVFTPITGTWRQQ